MIGKVRELLAEVRRDLMRGEIECLIVLGDKDFASSLDCGRR